MHFSHIFENEGRSPDQLTRSNDEAIALRQRKPTAYFDTFGVANECRDDSGATRGKIWA